MAYISIFRTFLAKLPCLWNGPLPPGFDHRYLLISRILRDIYTPWFMPLHLTRSNVHQTAGGGLYAYFREGVGGGDARDSSPPWNLEDVEGAGSTQNCFLWLIRNLHTDSSINLSFMQIKSSVPMLNVLMSAMGSWTTTGLSSMRRGKQILSIYYLCYLSILYDWMRYLFFISLLFIFWILFYKGNTISRICTLGITAKSILIF